MTSDTRSNAELAEQLHNAVRVAQFPFSPLDGPVSEEVRKRVTPAQYQTLLVHTALAYLLHHGLISFAPAEAWQRMFRCDLSGIPAELLPDVASELARAEAMEAAIRQQHRGPAGRR